MAGTSAADCTSATCPVEGGFFSAAPPLEGAAFMLAAFSALVPVNLWIGARCKTTTYTLFLVAGLLLEVMGYAGMLLLRSDLASKTYFVLVLLGTTLGPTLVTAATYTILPHILDLYGSDVCIVPEPVWLAYFFVSLDAFTVAFQAVGSAFTAGGYSKTETQQGINVIIAGLAFQIASILSFFGAYFLFMSRVVQSRQFLDPRFSDVYLSARFKTALICMQIALAFILARTVTRIVQFASGLGSSLSQSHAYTLVLDGALVLVATILLTVVPPGPSLGRAWGATSPSTRRARRHLAALDSVPRSPGSPLLYLQQGGGGGSAAPSPQYYHPGAPRGYYYGPGNNKEPRSPPPSMTTDGSSGAGTAMGSGYGYGYYHNNNNNNAPQQQAEPRSVPGRHSRRYSPSWLPSSSHNNTTTMRQPPAAARTAGAAEPPPYERPANKIAQVPYLPPSLSQQYGQGSIVESQVDATTGGSEGSRTGGSGGGGTTAGHTSSTSRTRRSPRVYEEDMVRHDAIW